MIGSILLSCLFSIGVSNAFITNNGFNVNWATNYVFDLNNDGADDKICFQAVFSNLGDYTDESYTMVCYIDNVYQSINTCYYGSDAVALANIPLAISTNKPSNISSNYSAIALTYTKSTQTGSYPFQVAFRFCALINSNWSIGSVSTSMTSYAYSFQGGEGSRFTIRDYYSQIRSDYLDGTYWQMGYLAQSYASWYTLSQQQFIIDCEYSSDITFAFYGLYDANDSIAYEDGYRDGYDDGYADGFEVGFEQGLTTGRGYGYQDGYTEGYNVGYDAGYSGALVINQNASFLNLFGLIADTPIMMLKSLFNWELFGFNVFTAILSLITGLVVIYLVKKVIH